MEILTSMRERLASDIRIIEATLRADEFAPYRQLLGTLRVHLAEAAASAYRLEVLLPEQTRPNSDTSNGASRIPEGDLCQTGSQ